MTCKQIVHKYHSKELHNTRNVQKKVFKHNITVKATYCKKYVVKL